MFSQLFRKTPVKWVFLAITLIGFSPLVANADCDNLDSTRVNAGDVRVPREVCIGNVAVPLKGEDLLVFWGFDVYSAALYAPDDATKSERLLNKDTPLRLELHYHRKVKAKDINKAMYKALEENPDIDFAAIRRDIDGVANCFQDVKDGDVYAVEFDPNTQKTTIFLNGIEQCSYNGAAFAEAFFGIWISDHPLNKKLAEALRGFDVPKD